MNSTLKKYIDRKKLKNEKLKLSYFKNIDFREARLTYLIQKSNKDDTDIFNIEID